MVRRVIYVRLCTRDTAECKFVGNTSRDLHKFQCRLVIFVSFALGILNVTT